MPPDEPPLRLRLIGQMGAWNREGLSVLPVGRKTRALLAYLALEGPRPVERLRLATLLWSGRQDDRARTSLRQEIHRLLWSLGSAGKEILAVTRDHVSFLRGAVVSDFGPFGPRTYQAVPTGTLRNGTLLEDLDVIDPQFDAWLNETRKRWQQSERDGLEPDNAPPTDDRRKGMADRPAGAPAGMPVQLGHTPVAVTHVPDDAAQTPLSLELGHAASSGVNQFERLPLCPANRGAVHIGVTPLRLASDMADYAVLADAFVADVRNALSRFRGIITPAGAANMPSPEGTQQQPGEQQACNVDFLLSGSVQNASSRVRISLRLIDLRVGNQIVWAGRFDKSVDQFMGPQSDLASEIAAQIEPEITLHEAKRRDTGATADASAQDLVLLALPLMNRLERGAFMLAGRHLSDAISLEPDYPAAHAWYAYWHIFIVSQNWTSSPTSMMQRAEVLAERAIILDPRDARCLTIAAHVRAFLHHRLPEASALHDRAVTLNPGLAMAWALSSLTWTYRGELAEAERRYQRYKALAPLHPHAFFYDSAGVLLHLLNKNHAAAVELGRITSQLNGSFSGVLKPYLAALGHLGDTTETATIRQRLLALEPRFTTAALLSRLPLLRASDRAHFVNGLRLAGIPD